MERLTRWIDEQKDIAIESKEATKDECLKKLADYEDAEEQGRLFKLPFAYGKTIFEIESVHDRILEWEVHGYDISPHAIYIKVGEYVEFNITHVGETIFRTREEAEAKLKEMEGDNAENHETK